ncbi:hypothetical protein ACWCQ0_50415, partial [Streptomyces massasporeus]
MQQRLMGVHDRAAGQRRKPPDQLRTAQGDRRERAHGGGRPQPVGTVPLPPRERSPCRRVGREGSRARDRAVRRRHLGGAPGRAGGTAGPAPPGLPGRGERGAPEERVLEADRPAPAAAQQPVRHQSLQRLGRGTGTARPDGRRPATATDPVRHRAQTVGPGPRAARQGHHGDRGEQTTRGRGEALQESSVHLELLVHLVPMLMGIAMSFKELTQFYIRNWGEAPWSGLDNYTVAIDFDAPVGQALLKSFLTTCLFTVLSVGLCWFLGTAAAIFLQENFRGRGFLRTLFLVPYALPVYAAVITWAFMFQRDNGLINHVLHDQLGIGDSPAFWLIGDNAFYTLLVVSV